MFPLGFPDVVPDHEILYPAPSVPPEGDTKMEPFPPLQGTLVGVLIRLITGGCEMEKTVEYGQPQLSRTSRL